MKHIWLIDGSNYNLHEGYVVDDYKDYEYDFVYKDEDKKHNLGPFKVENIFEDKFTALNIYETIIRNERKRIFREIEKLNRKNEILFEKLLDIHNL